MVSGYYAYSNDKSERKIKIKRQLIKIGKLTLYTCLFYLIWNIIKCKFNLSEIEKWWFEEFFNLKGIIGFLVLNRAAFLSSIVYYLFALLYTYLIYYILNKYNIIKKAYYAIPFLLIISLLLQLVVDVKWFYVGNWLLTALPFFMLGSLIREKQYKVRISKKIFILFMLLGIVSSIFQYMITKKVYYYDMGNIIFLIGTFLFCVQNSNENICRPIEILGAKYATMIFITHGVVIDISRFFFSTKEVRNIHIEIFSIIVFSILISVIITEGLNLIKSKFILKKPVN